METVGPTGPETSGGWYQHTFQVADIIAPTANIWRNTKSEGSLLGLS